MLQGFVHREEDTILDPKNNVSLTCGLVADPEPVNENIVKFRVAVDFAGSERGSGSSSGYFDVVYYLNDDDHGRNSKFVKSQIENQNFKKGSQLQLIGRLVQERWTSNEQKNSKVVIVAESLTYAGGGRANTNNDGSQTSNPGAKQASYSKSMPDSF